MRFFIVLLILFTACTAFAEGHLHPEKYYQKVWCDERGGITEYVLNDKTRVDCLTEEYAIEFEFAPKWAESIGQALYYGIKTDRQPGIVLIMENPEKDKRYLRRLKEVAGRYNIKIWIIPED